MKTTNSADEQENRWSEIRKELRAFAETTTVKGIGRTMRANNRVTRTCWILFLIVCLGLLLWQVAAVMSNYYGFVVVRKSSVVQTLPNFPHVTICNLFPVEYDDEFEGKYEKYVKMLSLLDARMGSRSNDAERRDFEGFLHTLFSYGVNVDSPEPHNHSNNRFVIECLEYITDPYVSNACSLRMVKARPLQNCVLLQPTFANTTTVRIVLFLNDFWSESIDSFFSWTRIQMSTGVRIIVHPRGTKPDPKTKILLPSGSDTTINVRQSNITRLSRDNKCTHRSHIDELLYTQPSCISICRQQQIIDECKCIDSFEYFTGNQLRSVHGTFCLNLTEIVEGARRPSASAPNGSWTAVEEFWNTFICYWYLVPSEDACDCPAPCSEVRYDYDVSSSRWPNPVYQRAFYEKYLRSKSFFRDRFSVDEKLMMMMMKDNGNNVLEETRTLRLIEDNFLQVTVTMSDRSVSMITDILAMSWDTMASNLGGSLNLWLGISVLTAAEIIELFYSLLKIVFNKENENRPTTSQRHAT